MEVDALHLFRFLMAAVLLPILAGALPYFENSAEDIPQNSFIALAHESYTAALLAPALASRSRKRTVFQPSPIPADMDLLSGLRLSDDERQSIEKQTKLLSNPTRVVAVGDLHGDLEATKDVLRLMQLTNIDDDWIGKDAVLVQTGDLCDRGPATKEVMQFFRQLSGKAAAAGGKVINILGNHEVMNLQGDLSYVSDEDVRHYGSQVARDAAFSNDGPDGRWLRSLAPTARVGDSVYVHGGITTQFAQHDVTGINAAALEALTKDDYSNAVFSNGGPLWYRGFIQEEDESICSELEESLKLLKAERMIVGHTRQEDGVIKTRCDSRLIMIDVGMSSVYEGGHLGALEMQYDSSRSPTSVVTKAVYADDTQDIPPPTSCKFMMNCPRQTV